MKLNPFRRKERKLPAMTCSQAAILAEMQRMTRITKEQIEARFPSYVFPPTSALEATVVIDWLRAQEIELHRTPLAPPASS